MCKVRVFDIPRTPESTALHVRGIEGKVRGLGDVAFVPGARMRRVCVGKGGAPSARLRRFGGLAGLTRAHTGYLAQGDDKRSLFAASVELEAASSSVVVHGELRCRAGAPDVVRRGQLQNSAWGRGRLHWRARPAGQPQHAALVPTGGRGRRGARGSCRPARCMQAQHAAGRGGRAPSAARPGEPRRSRDAHHRITRHRDARRRTSAR